MIKLFGLCFFVTGSFFMGLLKIQDMKSRRNTLEELIHKLSLMKLYLNEARAPMPVIFKNMENESGALLKSFFQNLNLMMENLGEESLYKIWGKAIDINFKDSLTKRQRDELKKLGASLGAFDAKAQSGAISLCISRLEEEREQAIRKLQENKGLYAGLSLTLGLIISLVLI